MKLIDSSTKFTGKIFKLNVDTLEHNGHVFTREYISYRGAVTAIPVLDKQIVFVKQYRHPAGAELLELPAGKLENHEEPLACMNRELQEEIGFKSNKIREISEFYTAPGYSTEYMYLFMAEELEPSKLPEDRDEFLTVVPIDIFRVKKMLKQGLFKDAKTIIGLLYFFSYLDHE